MDPLAWLTAGFTLADDTIKAGITVYNNMSPELRTQFADDYAKFFHNMAEFMLALQARANALVVIPAVKPS